MIALDAPTLACSDALGKEDKEKLAENIRDLRLMFTVRIYFSSSFLIVTKRFLAGV